MRFAVVTPSGRWRVCPICSGRIRPADLVTTVDGNTIHGECWAPSPEDAA